VVGVGRRAADPTDRPPLADDLAALGVALRAASLRRVEVSLPHDGRKVEVQTYLRNETLWTGDLPTGFGSVPNKVPYELDGSPLYPELVVVRLLELAGWGAAWRKAWNGQAYWRDLREPIEPPEAVTEALDQVSVYAGHTGQWDIVAWRDKQLRLVSSRPAGGLPVSAYQASWLSIALRMGLPSGCFAVVEHRVPRPPRRRRLEHIQPS
jgi:hypothetical protein